MMKGLHKIYKKIYVKIIIIFIQKNVVTIYQSDINQKLLTHIYTYYKSFIIFKMI